MLCSLAAEQKQLNKANAKIAAASAGPAMPTVTPPVSLSTVSHTGTRLRMWKITAGRGRRLQ